MESQADKEVVDWVRAINPAAGVPCLLPGKLCMPTPSKKKVGMAAVTFGLFDIPGPLHTGSGVAKAEFGSVRWCRWVEVYMRFARRNFVVLTECSKPAKIDSHSGTRW